MSITRAAARLFTGLFLAVILAACQTPSGRQPLSLGTPDAAPPEIRVMTYNIRVGVGLGKVASPKDPRENLDAIAALIKSSGADIVCLQEVDKGRKRTTGTDELAFLAAQTGLYGAYAPAFDIEGDGQFGVGILSRWPILDEEAIRHYRPDYSVSHPKYPDYYAEQRVALVARIDAPGGPITVINTHLGLTADQRAVQLKKMADLARKAAASTPVLIAGDFNAEPDAPELRPVRALLRDAYHLDGNDGALDPIKMSRRMTFPADKPDTCIDYIFVEDADWRVLETAVIDTQLSDHRPMMTRLARR